MVAWSAGFITHVGAIAIVLTTIFLVSASRPAESFESVRSRLLKVRGRYFVFLTAVIVIAWATTLPNLPYRQAEAEVPDYTVSVVGQMWSWRMDVVEDRSGDAVIEPAERRALEFPLGSSTCCGR